MGARSQHIFNNEEALLITVDEEALYRPVFDELAVAGKLHLLRAGCLSSFQHSKRTLPVCEVIFASEIIEKQLSVGTLIAAPATVRHNSQYSVGAHRIDFPERLHTARRNHLSAGNAQKILYQPSLNFIG